MTTIIIEKTIASVLYSISIDCTKITEQIDKPSGMWNDYVSAPEWATRPAKKNGMDSKNITNTYNIAGRIGVGSLSVNGTPLEPSECNTPYVRDVLRAFVYMGGTSTFKYGIPSDIVGLSYETVNLSTSTNPGSFYTNEGVGVQITKLSIDENPKGGDSGSQTKHYQNNGKWDADINFPVLTHVLDGDATTGHYWTVSVAGNTLLDGIGSWEVGDIALKKSEGWEKVSEINQSAVHQVPGSYTVQMAVLIVSEQSES